MVESPEELALAIDQGCDVERAVALITARDAAIRQETLAPFRGCLERLRGDIGSRASNWGAYRDTCARWRDELTRLLGLLPSAKEPTDG